MEKPVEMRDNPGKVPEMTEINPPPPSIDQTVESSSAANKAGTEKVVETGEKNPIPEPEMTEITPKPVPPPNTANMGQTVELSSDKVVETGENSKVAISEQEMTEITPTLPNTANVGQTMQLSSVMKNPGTEKVAETGEKTLQSPISEPEVTEITPTLPNIANMGQTVQLSKKNSKAGSIRSMGSELVKRKSGELSLFKAPPAPPKKRKVLEEDKFVEELEKIIQRDFFPDLEKLKAQNAYLNAVENNDIHMLRELYSKYSLGRTPRVGSGLTSTPSTFETPADLLKVTPALSTSSTPTHLPMESPARPNIGGDDDDAKSTSSKSSNKANSLTLNAYLDTYTSEDNQSFQEMMEDADTKHRIKYAWLYDKEKQHGERQKMALALPSIEKQAELPDKPFEVDTWGYRNQNYIMYVPNGVAFTPEEEVELAKRKTEVMYKNTRFKEAPFKSGDADNKNNLTSRPPTNKIGVDGKELESDTPKVNGFGFVRTPSPTPGVEESPYMTWGEIEGTPFRLDAGDTPIPVTDAKPYKMLETTKRERIAMELTEKVSQRYRDKKLKAIEAARSHLATPSPRPMSVMDRLSSMSPAAQRLARAKIGSSVVDKALRASYTPGRTPGSTRSLLNTPTPNSAKTPSKTPTIRRPATTSTASITTDDLLNLPASKKKRPSAADFF